MAEETTFRISNWDTPLRVNPNRTAGRFNEAGSAPTQYLCLHPLTPWAEYLRSAELREAADLAERRLRIWAVKVDLSSATEISFDNASKFGLEPDDLVSDEHGACRLLAEELRRDPQGPRMIVVPSAALPGTRNIVIFGERVAIPYSWTPLGPVDLPACVIAERSRPPVGIESRVNFLGEPHAELDAWRAGLPFRFPDLDC